MKLHDDGTFTALNWVKPALDATLAQAREALEAYVGNPHDLAPMRACTAHLHEVQGSLRMVELYGAAMVVENMERLAEGLVADRVRQRDESYSVLMRGMVQLPDYLERLQSGHKDIPIVLLPLLNDLRACRGENLLTESALFAPDLATALPPAANGRAQALDPVELRAQALRLRLAFQAALLKWFRDEGAAEHLNRLMDVLDRLRTISLDSDARRLWWIAAGVMEAVENGGLEASVAVKLLFGRVDREIHRFARDGEAGFAAAPPRELVKNLLYYIAHSGDAGTFPDGTRSAQIRTAYQLDTLLPTPGELQHAQGSMTGHNRSLLGTVSAAIKDDLLRVKEALDIFLRGGHADAGELEGQVELLDRVGDTLGMLGLGVPRRVVGEQRDIIGEMAHRQRPVDEGTLLDVAGALLYVEASLDDHIDRLGANDAADSGSGDGTLELPQAEVRRILDALMREASANIEQAKHDIVAFIESPWDHVRVGRIPQLLEEIAGALRMLGLAEPADLMTAVVRFVEVELITHRRVPTAEQMDQLADALAAIEYYLEAAREQRRNRDRILDVARESLEALGYWPMPAMHADDRMQPDATTEAAALELQQAVDLAYPEPDQAMPVLSQGEAETPQAPAGGTPPLRAPGLPSLDMLPGEDLHDLMVGDAAMQEPALHDLSGLRLAETEALPVDGPTARPPGVAPAIDEFPGGFELAASEDIDDDIRAVFIEEVEEEIVNMQRQLPLWQRDVANFDELKSLRRSFHTLKGSGRLVGARGLGEFSWKVEGLLNRVLDQSIAPSNAVVALIEHAVAAVPVLLAALRGDRGGHADIAGIMAVADRLAAGEDAWLGGEHASAPASDPAADSAAHELPVFADDIRSAGHLADETGFEASPQGLVAGPLPNVDPVLFDILQSEVAAHLGVIEDYLADCEPETALASGLLLRAAHTLNGAIAMVDIPAIGNVLGPLESYIKRLRGVGAAPSAEGIVALHDTVALTRGVMQCLEARDPNLPDSSTLVARVAALRDALPEVEGLLHWYDDGSGAVAAAGTLSDGPANIEGEIPVPTEPAASEMEAHADVEMELERVGGGEIEVATGAEVDDGTEIGNESDAAMDAAVETGAEVEAEVAADTDAETAIEAGAESEVETCTEVELDTEVEQTEADTQTEAGTSARVDDAAAPGFDEMPRPSASLPASDIDFTGTWLEQAGAVSDQHTLPDPLIPADLIVSLADFDAGTPPAPPGGDESFAAGMDEDVQASSEESEREGNEEAGQAAADVDPLDAGAEFAAARTAADFPLDAADADLPLADDRAEGAEAAQAEHATEVTHVAAHDLMADLMPQATESPSEAPSESAAAMAGDTSPAGRDERPVEADRAAATQEEPTAPARPASRAPLTGAAPPPLADDPQPDGVLTLADIDDDLLDIFVQEGTDILDHCDSMVASLREAPHERSPLVELQRDLHTLKGGARMAGLAPVGDLSHAMESVVDALSDGQLDVDRGVVESLEGGFDRLHELVKRVARRREIAMPVHAIARFESLVAHRGLLAAVAARCRLAHWRAGRRGRGHRGARKRCGGPSGTATPGRTGAR